MAKVSTNIGIDGELKKEAQELLADLGLDLTTAVNIFLRQTVREQRIPFEIGRGVSNADTLAAMREVEYMKAHPEEYKTYASFGDIVKDVMADA